MCGREQRLEKEIEKERDGGKDRLCVQGRRRNGVVAL